MFNSKKGSKTSKTSRSVKQTEEYYDDDAEFQNSEDEYPPSDEDLDNSGGSDDENTQSGGLSDAPDDELGEDSATLDIDPDDEAEYDTDGDEKFNPIDEMGEPEDPDDPSEQEEDEVEDLGSEDVDNVEIEDDAADIEDLDPELVDEARNSKSKQCYMKNLNKDFIALDEDDSGIYSKIEYKKIPDNERETDPILTYYEIVRILGTRAQQFNYGAKPLIKGVEGMHPAKMAFVELTAKMTPFIVRRHLPGKKYEDWRIDELGMIHTITEELFVPDNFNWDSITALHKTMISNQQKNSTTDTETLSTQENASTRVSGSNLRSRSGSKSSKSNNSRSASKSNSRTESKSNSRTGSKSNSRTGSKSNSRTGSKSKKSSNTKSKSKRNSDNSDDSDYSDYSE